MKKIAYSMMFGIVLLIGQSTAYSQLINLNDSTCITKGEKLACAECWARESIKDSIISRDSISINLLEELIIVKDSSIVFLIEESLELEDQVSDLDKKISRCKKLLKWGLPSSFATGFIGGMIFIFKSN